jgi:hypothetical protein
MNISNGSGKLKLKRTGNSDYVLIDGIIIEVMAHPGSRFELISVMILVLVWHSVKHIKN